MPQLMEADGSPRASLPSFPNLVDVLSSRRGPPQRRPGNAKLRHWADLTVIQGALPLATRSYPHWDARRDPLLFASHPGLILTMWSNI